MGKAKTWEEYKAECETVAKEGITVLGFLEPWKGDRTKILCNCVVHGDWSTLNILRFKQGAGCPICWVERRKVSRLIAPAEQLRECQALAPKELKVLGYFGKYIGSRSKLLLHCEQHGEWNTTSVSDFKSKSVRCPKCSGKSPWVWNDSVEYLKKEAITRGYSLLGYVRPWSGAKTKLKLACPEHGTWVTTNLSSFVNKRRSCPKCCTTYSYTWGEQKDSLNSVAESLGYTLVGYVGEWKGNNTRLELICPTHGVWKTTIINTLKHKGTGCPSCSGNNQQECYINLVYDNNLPISLKFGISNESPRRLKRQNNKNLFQMEQTHIFEFPSVQQCKDAEKACKDELQCGILNSRELQDGWTETTSIQNLDKIIEIYERFGGVLIKDDKTK